MYDIIIRGGTVIDGTGKPGYKADVAVKDGKIAAIGDLSCMEAEKVLDATQRLVSQDNLTTLMVTHNLRYAVEYGDRLLMMHQGHIEMDLSGDSRKGLKVDDLLRKFNEISIECGN